MGYFSIKIQEQQYLQVPVAKFSHQPHVSFSGPAAEQHLVG